MKSKLTLAAGIAIGYLAASKRNREQVARQAKSLWRNPAVQEQVSHAQDVVREQAPVVREQLSTAAGKVKDKVGSGSGSGSSSSANGTPSGYTPAP